jgi:hypothetical protein
MGRFIHIDNGKVLMEAAEEAFGCVGEWGLLVVLRGMCKILFTTSKDSLRPLIQLLLVGGGVGVVPREASDTFVDVLREV